MKPITCWLLYNDPDFEINRDFAAFVQAEGQRQGFVIRPVLVSQLRIGMKDSHPYAWHKDGSPAPDVVLSRQRDPFLSGHLESMNVPVYNNAAVCALCNDKRKTYQLLQGLPMLDSAFVPSPPPLRPPEATAWPVILKPASSHGGDRVLRVENEQEWQKAAKRITKDDQLLQQPMAKDAGMDLRVYVVFGKIVAGVMRRARSGFLSNFKQGGQVSLHTLTMEETALARQVIDRFAQAGAPLSLAGIDFLYENGSPVLGEVEDVVGSRMLYKVSDINIMGIFLDELRTRLEGK